MKHTLVFICMVFSCGIFSQSNSEYAGQESRIIKSLSAEQVDGYLSGKGMGQAKAAELNGYPGPKHVLDLSDKLNLTPEQIRKTNALYSSMQSESKKWGSQLIELESQLDQLFSGGEADRARLNSLLTSIGKVQAQIRFSHLAAHIEQKKVLTPHQIALYHQYRGYGASHGDHAQHRH